MKTAGHLFSMIQTNVNDIAGTRIGLAEYPDFMQIVAEELAQKIKVWIDYKKFTPNPSTNPVTPSPFTLTIPSSVNCTRILQLFRNGVKAREYSRQAVTNQVTGNYAFDTNQVILPGNDFYSFRNPDESMMLTFTDYFDQDEEVYIEMLVGRPFDILKWTQDVEVPDYLFNVFLYGVKHRVFERLFDSGSPVEKQMALAQKEYIRYLSDAKAYTNNFHDESSPVRRQSNRWLSDNKTMFGFRP